MQTEPSPPPVAAPQPRLHRRHIGMAATGMLLLAVGILVPAAAFNFTKELVRPSAKHAYALTPLGGSAPGSAAGTRLQITLEGLTPWDNTMRLQVAGHRSCETVCAALRVLIVSLPASNRESGILPTAEGLNLPAGVSDVNQTYTLPIEGEWIDYPFDSYVFTLGLVEQRIRADGSVEGVSSQAGGRDITVTLEERLSDITLLRPRQVDPDSVAPFETGYPYVLVSELSLRRPFYEQGITTAVILLAVAAAAYGVFMRPFRELAIGATGLTLSLWGVRSLLMGQQPGTTTVDLILISVIIFVLVGITARVLIALVRGRDAE